MRRRRSRAAIAADERHEEVYPAWRDVRLDRDAEKNKNHPAGRATAQRAWTALQRARSPKPKASGKP